MTIEVYYYYSMIVLGILSLIISSLSAFFIYRFNSPIVALEEQMQSNNKYVGLIGDTLVSLGNDQSSVIRSLRREISVSENQILLINECINEMQEQLRKHTH